MPVAAPAEFVSVTAGGTMAVASTALESAVGGVDGAAFGSIDLVAEAADRRPPLHLRKCALKSAERRASYTATIL